MLRTAGGLCLLGAAFPGTVDAQLEAFRYDSTRVPVGHAYHYLKSNRDGSHPGRVTVYVPARDRLESLKWQPGGTEATLVTAQIDWPTFSVRRFDAWHLARGVADERQAWLVMGSGEKSVRTSFTGDTLVPLARLPWHSYDFDFASLALVLPHLRDPESAVLFERADVVFKDDAATTFADRGEVRLRFDRREQRARVASRRYVIGGPGLEDSTGVLWTDARTGWMLEFQLPVPDEPGYRDGRLRLESTERMTPTEWAGYKRKRVGE